MKKSYLFILLAAFVILGVIFFVSKNKKISNPVIEEKVNNPPTALFRTLSPTSVFFTDMENPDTSAWMGTKNPEEHFSGNFSNKLSPQTEYGITFIRNVNDFTDREKIRQVNISFQVKSAKPPAKASLVYAVTGPDGMVVEYNQQPIASVAAAWTPAEYTFPVDPAKWKDKSTIKVYPWNEGKETFYIDDIKIEFLAETEQIPGIQLGPQQNFIFNYEPAPGAEPSGMLSREVAHSGSYSMVLEGADVYSETVTKKFSEIATDTVQFISTSVWIYPKENNPVVTLVVSIEKPDGTSISWQGKATDRMSLSKNEWHKINFRADLRELKTTQDDIIKIYTWNKKGGTVFVDDLEIVYGDVPLPHGESPGAKMDMYGNPVMVPGKNRPPFPSAFLTSVPGTASAGVYLVNEGSNHSGELRPDEAIISGNFSGSKNNMDLLLTAKGSHWSLFGYCSKENRFANLFETTTGPDLNGKIILRGHFDDPQKASIVLIDTSGKVSSLIVSFTGLSEPCGPKREGAIHSREASFMVPLKDPDWKSIAVGNFTGDNRTDLIIFNKTNDQYNITSLKGNNWEQGPAINFPHGTIAGIYPLTAENGYDSLILFTQNKSQLDYCLMEFTGSGNKGTIRTWKDKSFLQHYSEHSEFFTGYFGKSRDRDLFYLNQDWRLDLKQIRMGNDGLFVESQMDFQQSDNNRNPRFYEFTRIVAGRFFESDRKSFLAVMSNCKDSDFDGKSCAEFEEVMGLPSGYQFYQFNATK